MKTINRKAEFDLQNFLVTFVLFIAVMVTFGLMATDMNSMYEPITGDTIDGSFVDTYDQLSELDAKAEDINAKVIETDTGSTDSGSEFLGDALNSLKLIAPSLHTTSVMIDNMATSIGVPPIWFRALGLIMILMIVTLIIFMIFRYR